MPQCKKCGKSGLFLKMEKDTGLCLSCNEGFAKEGKMLTEKITAEKQEADKYFAKEGRKLTEKIVAEREIKNKVGASEYSEKLNSVCKSIEEYGNKLIALHQAYNLQPSQELLDIIETYKRMRELAEN